MASQESTQTSLADFWDLLDQHDWLYEMSDDGGVYRAGRRERDKIQTMAKLSPEHQKLYTEFTRHIFNGTPWGTPEIPKPQRPK